MPRTVYVPEAGGPLNFPDGTTDQQILTYVKTRYAPPPPPAPPQEEVGAFGAGIASFLGQSEYGVGKAAQAAGLEGLSKYLYDQAQQNTEYASKYKPDVASVTDIGGVGDAASWLGSTVLQTLPNMGAGYAATAAGTLVGGPVGGVIGFALSQLPAFVGGNMQEQMQQRDIGPEQTAAIPATVGAAAQLPIDFVADRLIFRGLPVTGEIAKLAKRAFIGEVVKIAAAEGLSESAQQAIQIAQANPDRLLEFGPEVQQEILNAAAAGIAVGGVLGGASTGIGNLRSPAEPKPVPQIEQDIRAGSERGQQTKRNGEINLGVQALSQRQTIGNLRIAPVKTPTGTRFALQDAQGTTIADFSDPVLATSAVDQYKKLAGKDIRVQSAVSQAEVPTTNEATIKPVAQPTTVTTPQVTPPAPIEAAAEPVAAPEAQAAPEAPIAPVEESPPTDIVAPEPLAAPEAPVGAIEQPQGIAAIADAVATEPVAPVAPEAIAAEVAPPVEAVEQAPEEAPPAAAPIENVPAEDLPPALPAQDEIAVDEAAQEEARQRLAERTQQIGEELGNQLKQYNLKGVDLQFIPAFTDALGRPTTQRGSESVKDGKSIIKISMAVFDADLSVEDMVNRAVEILNHESIHSLSDLGLLRPVEMKMLFEAAAKTKVPGKNYTYLDYAKRVYEPLAKTNPVYQNSEAIAEEGVAEMFRDWRKGQKNIPSGIRGIINRVFDILRRMFGGMKKLTHEDVFRDITKGKIGRRTPDVKVNPNAKVVKADTLPSDYREDNPGEDYVRGKISYAIDMAKKYPRGSYSKFLSGAVTAYAGHDGKLMLPVKELSKVRGVNNENRIPGDGQYDELKKSVDEKGYTNESPVMVFVNHKGEAYINEGNTRVAVAKDKGVDRIAAWVHWFNGAEGVDGNWSPESVASMERTGKASADPDNPEFQQWFEGSHGTTSGMPDGSPPKVFYHGTSKDANFTKFKTGMRGIWFTDNPDSASQYAIENDSMGSKPGPGWTYEKVNTASRVIPAYLSYKNPYTLTDEDLNFLNRGSDYRKTQRELFSRIRAKDPTIDSVIFADGVVVVFDPRQIKSVFNNFDTGAAKSDKFDMDPEFPELTVAPSYPFGRRVPQVTAAQTNDTLGRVEYGAIITGISKFLKMRPLNLIPDRFKPSEEQLSAFVQNFADKNMPLGQLVDYIRQNGGNVPDALDVYMQAQLIQSQTWYQKEIRDKILFEPVVKAIKDGGLTREEVQEYLYALHAPERNAFIRARNPGADPELGSGMSDKRAAEIIARVQQDPRYAAYENVRSLVRAIIDDTNRLRVEAGLTPDFDGLVDENGKPVKMTRFENYFPLRGFAEESDTEGDEYSGMRARTGQGFKIRGREDMRALGRTSEAGDIIAHAMLQNTEALVRAAKNTTNLSLLGLIETNPELTAKYGISVMSQKPLKKYLSPNGIVKTIIDPMYKNRDDVLVVKRDGNEIAIQIDNDFLQKALIAKRGGDPEMGGHVMRFLQKMNRILASASTVYNPEFMLINFPRDLQQAMISIDQYGIDKVKTKILKDAFPAVKNVWELLRNPDAQNGWSQIYKDFREDGGPTSGFIGALTIQEQLGNLEKMTNQLDGVREHRIKEAFKFIGGMLEHANGAFENAVRLSVYKNTREAMVAGGVSEDVARMRAAMIAKNLTVNFDQRGLYGPLLNSLYLFYNASVQGTFGLLSAGFRSKKVRRTIRAIVVAGAMQDFINSLMSDRGDDDEPIYDKIPGYKLQNNIIIMDPFGYTDKGYFAIPLSYGANAFYNMGRVISRSMRGRYSTSEAVTSMGSTFVDAFNPIGGTESFLNFVMPTAIDPIVALSMNMDYSGKRIYPEAFPGTVPKADSQMFFTSTSPLFKTVADVLNKATGGTEYVPGLMDFSPDAMEYVFDYATGGAGAFVRRLIDTGSTTVPALLQGDLDNVEINSVPFLRKLYGNVSDRASFEDYFDKVSHVLARGEEWKSAVKEGDPQRIKDVKARFGDEIAIYPAIRALANRRNQLASELRKVRENEKIPPELKRRRIEALRKQIDVITQRVNKLYGQKIGNKYPGLFS